MFLHFSLAVNSSVFVAAAALVWFAGTRLARYADAIAEKTGIARELLGLFLLGGVTSLPELSVAATASLTGTPALSIGDLLGSAAVNVVILALADAVFGRRALTSTLASPGVLLQGVLGIILLSLVLVPVVVGDRLVFGMGAWTWLMLAVYFVSVRTIANSQGLRSWVPAGKASQHHDQSSTLGLLAQRSLNHLIRNTVVVGAAILGAGFLLATTGAAIADQTGLGASFVGAAFLALATSLPEVSTVLAAVRLSRYEMAIADVFGTNLFNVTIIVLVDFLYAGEPVLVQVGRFAAFGALLAIVLTALFIAGIIERRDRTFFRMGIDSLVALACYTGGLVVLYRLA